MHEHKTEVKDVLVALVLTICISQHSLVFFTYLLLCMINIVLRLKQCKDICRSRRIEVLTGLITFLPKFLVVRLQPQLYNQNT